MAGYKPQDRNSLLLPVVLSEQIVPGSFAFALNYLVDHELDLTAMDAKFKNNEVGASAYDPRVMLKIVLPQRPPEARESRKFLQIFFLEIQRPDRQDRTHHPGLARPGLANGLRAGQRRALTASLWPHRAGQVGHARAPGLHSVLLPLRVAKNRRVAGCGAVA